MQFIYLKISLTDGSTISNEEQEGGGIRREGGGATQKKTLQKKG